ncbi:MAG: DNA polymerase/3'-5' exonuclease PolX [Actinobacteria bacterium]|nr:DNA polymerase/3'-5' exonuclease PolX [Actinomycetota bacterium]
MSRNAELAQVFAEIADVLDLTGANAFRVNAHRKVARAIEECGEDVATIALADPARLRSIPGIGDSSAHKIEEWARTGRVVERDELLATVPAGVPGLLQVPGLGPKRVRTLWQEGGVDSVDALRARLAAGTLGGLPGMGPKTLKAIEDALRFMEASRGRVRLGEAMPVAMAFAEVLRRVPGVKRVSHAGSLRRGRETIGDIDLVASGTDHAALHAAIRAAPGVVQVIASGETKTSVRTDRGLQVDLRTVDDDRFGAALLYFTGSKEHNVRLRERAQRMGMRLNEYGLFTDDGEAAPQDRGAIPLAAKDEEDVYRALGLWWMPPELREDHGELERHPPEDLVRVEDIRAELHCHTTASDGTLEIEAMVQEAVRRGFHTIAITDHSRSQAQANGLDAARLATHAAAVREVAKAWSKRIAVLAGSEVDILADGSLDYPDEVLAALDFVVASPHSALRAEPAAATERLLAAIRHPLVHVIGHPTGRIVGAREGLSPDIALLAKEAAARKVALEVNANAMRLDLRDSHVRLCVEAGCLVAIDTDAHGAGDFDELPYGVATARRGWLPASLCVNAWDRDRLLAWVRSKR